MIPELDPTRSFHHRMKQRDRLISFLHRIIRYAVKVLAVLMTLVILWGVVDVVWIIYQRIRTPPVFILNINDILATFGGFLAVLISMEIFVNIILYLEDEFIQVKLVLATALMAAARKVIIFDYTKLDYKYVWATGLVIVALSVSYWFVSKKDQKE